MTLFLKKSLLYILSLCLKNFDGFDSDSSVNGCLDKTNLSYFFPRLECIALRCQLASKFSASGTVGADLQDNYHRFCTFPPHRIYLTLVVGNFFGHFGIKPAGEGDAGKRISEYLDTICYELEYRFPELFTLNADVSYNLGPVSINFSGFNLIVHHGDPHSLSNTL